MNVRQKARRSDALHYDYISRRDLCNMIANLESDLEDARKENARLQELATYALKHIIEVWCDDENNDLFRGKPCENCADSGSSDCPKCMPRMFGVSGIEVDE